MLPTKSGAACTFWNARDMRARSSGRGRRATAANSRKSRTQTPSLPTAARLLPIPPTEWLPPPCFPGRKRQEKRRRQAMINRRFILPAFAALALAAFLSPSTAKAQGSVWDRIRDRAERERDRDNNRNGRRRDDDDRNGRRGGRVNDNERRQLRDLARRIS